MTALIDRTHIDTLITVETLINNTPGTNLVNGVGKWQGRGGQHDVIHRTTTVSLSGCGSVGTTEGQPHPL